MVAGGVSVKRNTVAKSFGPLAPSGPFYFRDRILSRSQVHGFRVFRKRKEEKSGNRVRGFVERFYSEFYWAAAREGEWR